LWALSVFLLAATPAMAADQKGPPQVGQRVVDFTLKTPVRMPRATEPRVRGKRVSTAKVRKGKILVLSFGVTWVEPCRQQVPHLNQLKAAYPKDVFILDVSVGEEGEDVLARNKSMRVRYVTVTDARGSVARRYGIAFGRGDEQAALRQDWRENVTGIPLLLIVDKQGKIVFRNGYSHTPFDTLKAVVDRLLAAEKARKAARAVQARAEEKNASAGARPKPQAEPAPESTPRPPQVSDALSDMSLANVEWARAKVYKTWPFDAKEAKRRQQETASTLGVPVARTVDLGGGVKLRLVLVPAGDFMMGSPPGEEKRLGAEGPQHRVRITKPFYIGKHEVTQAQWERITGENPSYFKGAKNPVENVAWDDCQAFLEKLNAHINAEGAVGLPTEAEWEYACRAGTATPFHTGETISTDEANYDGNYTYAGGRTGIYRQKAVPVGHFRPNAFGLCDMHGNVWEWCADRYDEDYYGRSPKEDAQGADSGNYRVLRGGAWRYFPRFCRSAYRFRNAPGYRDRTLGVRVVLRDFTRRVPKPE